MDHKRDSRSQRTKNLQYKSRGRGRGRHREVNQGAPANDAVVNDSSSEAEDEQHKRSTAGSNRLGSNWDRYVEPGEEDFGAGPEETGAVKKQSEGLDYNSLLEEADALLSGGAAALLKHFTLEEESEDVFSGAEIEEQPLPLGIDLHALNEALSCLTLPERLGLECELFESEEDEEPSTATAPTPIGASDSNGQANAASKVGTEDRITGWSKTTAASTPSKWAKDSGVVAGFGPPEAASNRPATVVRNDTGTGRGEAQPVASSSGQDANENAALLALLLGESDRPGVDRGGKSIAGPVQGTERTFTEQPKNSQPDGKSGADASVRGTVPRQPRGKGHERMGRDESDLLVSESGAGSIGSFVGDGRVAKKEGRGSVERPAAHPTVSSATEDDIDGLLAVLAPSGSTAKTRLPADKPSTNGRPEKDARSRENASGTGASRGLPQSAAVSIAAEISRKPEAAAERSKATGEAAPSSTSQAAKEDDDFDAWLDSIS